MNPLATPDLYTRFYAKRFVCPTVAYLNKRYWLSEGVDLESEAERAALEHRLLDKFGVSVPAPEFHPTWAFENSERVLYADRYGAAQGMLHGGSGRCGTVGNLNAKGIGRTPLCNMAKDWYHTHGCVWMEEAIREAIFSEVAQRTFPRTAMPVVAVIDTGEYVGLRHRDRGARRAIIIRPSTLRLSHLERSVYFGDGGRPDSPQFLDAKRTRQCIEMVFHGRSGCEQINERLLQLFESAAEQIGFGQVHRLFQGDYHSSNISIDGALIDFGAFRMVPDWRRRKWDAKGAHFGDESLNLFHSIYSILFQCRKYLCSELSLNTSQFRKILDAVISDTRRRELSLIVSPNRDEPAWGSEVVDLLAQEFDRQQSLPPVDHSGGNPHKPTGRRTESEPMFCERFTSAIGQILTQSVGSGKVERAAALRRIKSWNRPIGNGSREVVHYRTNRFLELLETCCNRKRRDTLTTRYIESWVTSLYGQLRERHVTSDVSR